MANEELTGVQKAAILLIALGPEKSATIFKHLKEDEIEELTLEIANTRSVSPQTKEAVLEEFYQVCLAQQILQRVVLATQRSCLTRRWARIRRRQSLPS